MAFSECLVSAGFLIKYLKEFNNLLLAICLRSVLQSDWVNFFPPHYKISKFPGYLFLWKTSGFLEKKLCQFLSCIQLLPTFWYWNLGRLLMFLAVAEQISVYNINFSIFITCTEIQHLSSWHIPEIKYQVSCGFGRNGLAVLIRKVIHKSNSFTYIISNSSQTLQFLVSLCSVKALSFHFYLLY